MNEQKRAKMQKYPKWEDKLDNYQLKLNRAAVMSNMKLVGKYNTLIDELWKKYHQK